jgi:hypothetical protein
MLVAALINAFLFSFWRIQILKRTAIGFAIPERAAAANQFWRVPLLDAIYALLVMAVNVGYFIEGPEEGWRVVLGAFFLWGVIEALRYISITRSLGRIR